MTGFHTIWILLLEIEKIIDELTTAIIHLLLHSDPNFRGSPVQTTLHTNK